MMAQEKVLRMVLFYSLKLSTESLVSLLTLRLEQKDSQWFPPTSSTSRETLHSREERKENMKLGRSAYPRERSLLILMYI